MQKHIIKSSKIDVVLFNALGFMNFQYSQNVTRASAALINNKYVSFSFCLGIGNKLGTNI